MPSNTISVHDETTEEDSNSSNDTTSHATQPSVTIKYSQNASTSVKNYFYLTAKDNSMSDITIKVTFIDNQQVSFDGNINHSHSTTNWHLHDLRFQFNEQDGQLSVNNQGLRKAKVSVKGKCLTTSSGVTNVSLAISGNNYDKLTVDTHKISFPNSCGAEKIKLTSTQLHNYSSLLSKDISIKTEQLHNRSLILAGNNIDITSDNIHNDTSLYVYSHQREFSLLLLATKFQDKLPIIIKDDKGLKIGTLADGKPTLHLVDPHFAKLFDDINFTTECTNHNLANLPAKLISYLAEKEICAKTGIYARGSLTVTTTSLNNPDGAIFAGGAKTSLATSSLCNFGIIGDKKSNTTLQLNNQSTGNADLGELVGSEVNLNIKNGDTLLQQGAITTNKVTVTGDKFLTSGVALNTQHAVLKVNQFQLDEQKNCALTTWQIPAQGDIHFEHPYSSSGDFIIQQANTTAAQAKASILQTIDSKQPKPANGQLALVAPITADNITFITPDLDLQQGKDEQQNHIEILGNKITAYTNNFDIVNGGLAGKYIYIAAANKLSVGRLIEDPSRKAIATFFSHSQSRNCMNLGSRLKPINFTFLGKNRTSEVYDGKHLLSMPVAISNNSFIEAKELFKVEGQLWEHCGTLNTKDLQSNVISTHNKAGVINVSQNFALNGKLHLSRLTTNLTIKHFGEENFKFCNSDAATVRIQGILHGDYSIANEASILHIHKTDTSSSNLDQIQNTNFTSDWYQQFIAVEELSTISKLSNLNIDKLERKISASWLPTCSVDYSGAGKYVINFLVNTNGFANAIQTFESQLSFGTNVVLPTENTKLQGFITGNSLLVLHKSSGKLAITNSTLNHADVHPVRNLAERLFNSRVVTINSVSPAELFPAQFNFIVRERFWFDQQLAQKFYQDIKDSIIVEEPIGTFNKLQQNTNFYLTPNLLLEKVRQETSTVLKKGTISNDQEVNLEFLQQLHHNAYEYFTQQHQSSSNAVALPSSNLAKKPMLYYHAVIDEQNNYILNPILYFPLEMVIESRTHIKLDNFIIMPEELSPQQMLERLPMGSEPQIMLAKLLASQNLLCDNHPSSNAVQTVNHTGEVLLSGNMQIRNTMAVAPCCKVTVDAANIEAQDALLASLYDNVEFKAIVKRLGNNENFQEVIRRARVAAHNILCILGKNVIMHAAETKSELDTHIQALGNIIGLPVTTLGQRIERYYSEKYSSETIERHWEQHTNIHQARNISFTSGESTVLYSPVVHAKRFQILAGGAANLFNVTEASGSITNTKSKKSGLFGSKTTTCSTQQVTQTSKPAILDVEELAIMGQQEINLCHIKSLASKNVLQSFGKVHISHGKNSLQQAFASSSKDLLWQKVKSSSFSAVTYSASQFTGDVEIQANQVLLDTVAYKTLDFLNKLQVKQGAITYNTLHEYAHRESHSCQGPSAGLSIVVSLAVGIATAGPGAAIAKSIGLAANGAAAAAVTAGFSTVCSHAAVSLLANEGDPFKAISSLGSADCLESLAMSMISAGVLNEVSKAMKLPAGFEQKTFIEHAKYAIAKAGVQTALNVSFKKQSLSDALKVGIVDIITTTCANTMLNKLSIQHKQGQLDLISHKLFNTILGGVEGAIINGEKGAIAGMLAAYSTETLLQLFGNEKVVADAINEHSADATNNPNKQRLLKQADKARVISSIISLLANTDIATANKVTERHLTEGFLILPEPQDRDSIANLDIGQQNAPTQQELLVNGEAANQSMPSGEQEGDLAEHADATNIENSDSLNFANSENGMTDDDSGIQFDITKQSEDGGGSSNTTNSDDNLLDTFLNYKQDDESWIGMSGRFLREAGIRDCLDNGFETLGEWTDIAIKSVAGLPERAVRGIARQIGADVRGGAHSTEQTIDNIKLIIVDKITKDAKGIVPILANVVEKYNITDDELLAVRTALEVAPFAKGSKLAAKSTGRTIQRGLTKLDDLLPAAKKPLLFSSGTSELETFYAGIGRTSSSSTKVSEAAQTRAKNLEKGIPVDNEASSTVVKPDRTINDPLRRNKHGRIEVDPEFEGKPHTQLGTRKSDRGDYLQGREFDRHGNPVKDIDCTNHGRADHPNPHQHKYEPNPTGGTYKRGGPETIEHPNNPKLRKPL